MKKTRYSRRLSNLIEGVASLPLLPHQINLDASSLVLDERTNPARRPNALRTTPMFMSLLTTVLFLALSVLTHADSRKQGVDFSKYDVPVYEQITNRIKEKVLARLGEGRNTRDRYFIIPFAYENDGNDPEFSHSFLSVIRVYADGAQPRTTPGLKARSYRHREFEAFTISWLPHDFLENPNLCVFEGFGARLFPKSNQCPVSVGKNFNLESTIKLGANVKNAIGMWGPYEITKGGFDLGVKRMRLLDAGSIKYRADDRLNRKDREAINCFHAIAGLDVLFPNGGLFGTGFKMWGLNGTARVLIEYTTKASNKGLLLEPVDIKKDRYGFVYAPDRSGRGIYNPFKNASAYHR
jgi:hypothetical protein